jgi:hypothetical protein
MRTGKHGAGRNRKSPAATSTFSDPLCDRPGGTRFRPQWIGRSVRPAMRANRPARPSRVFEQRPRGVLVQSHEPPSSLISRGSTKCTTKKYFEPNQSFRIPGSSFSGSRQYRGVVSRFRQTGVQKGNTRMAGDPIVIVGNFLIL